MFSSSFSLKRVILGRDLICEELVEQGDLLHDVVAHPWHFCEEEEREEACCSAKSAGDGTAVGRVTLASCAGAREVAREGAILTDNLMTLLRVMPW